MTYTNHADQLAAGRRSYRKRFSGISATRKEKWSLRSDERKARDAERRRVRHLWNKYGMTVEQWDALLAGQGGRCVCGAESPGGRHSVWQLDHDHSRPKGEGNRGLLCYACNTTVGTSKESPERLRCLANYIEAHRC